MFSIASNYKAAPFNLGIRFRLMRTKAPICCLPAATAGCYFEWLSDGCGQKACHSLIRYIFKADAGLNAVFIALGLLHCLDFDLSATWTHHYVWMGSCPSLLCLGSYCKSFSLILQIAAVVADSMSWRARQAILPFCDFSWLTPVAMQPLSLTHLPNEQVAICFRFLISDLSSHAPLIVTTQPSTVHDGSVGPGCRLLRGLQSPEYVKIHILILSYFGAPLRGSGCKIEHKTP